MDSEDQPDANSTSNRPSARENQSAGGKNDGPMEGKKEGAGKDSEKNNQPPTQAPQTPVKVEAATSASVQVSTKPKKPKAPARTPAKKAYDELVAARKKIDEKIEEACLKMLASDRQHIFVAAQKMIHDVLLKVEKNSRESALSGFEILLNEDQQKLLTDYQMAITSEVAAVAATAEKGANKIAEKPSKG